MSGDRRTVKFMKGGAANMCRGRTLNYMDRRRSGLSQTPPLLFYAAGRLVGSSRPNSLDGVKLDSVFSTVNLSLELLFAPGQVLYGVRIILLWPPKLASHQKETGHA